MKTVTYSNLFPLDKQAHLTVLEFVKVLVPGDEKYGATQETYTKLHIFEDQAELEEWLAINRNAQCIVLSAQRVRIKHVAIIEFE